MYRIPDDSIFFQNLAPFEQKRRRNKGLFLPKSKIDYLCENAPDVFSMDDVQIVGCGYCDSCRLKYSRDWAIRCQLEAERHETNYFITLTYDSQNIPVQECIDYLGNIWDTVLDPRDPQLFLKSYREWDRTTNGNTGMKVFMCGEYGDEYGRPHYHICLFGSSPLPDLKFLYQKGGFKYYSSALVDSFWSSNKLGIKAPRGYAVVSECSFDSIAYTARYVLKKQKGKMKSEFMDYYNEVELDMPIRLQPFVRMSRRPGIAHDYYQENKLNIYSEDLVKYHKRYELFSAKPPRYFDSLFDIDEPEIMAKIRENRKKVGIESRKARLDQTTESEEERLKREADIISSRLKKMKRPLA